jgi:4-amino-4-deoxy-L-arabinose transferase-like glycosyltransferase
MQCIRHQVLIVLVAGLICFVNLGATGLWDLDEALYTSIAREMSARGDWVVPTFNTNVFYDKPPLMFWLMMGSFKFLGQSEFAARLPAALLAIGTTLATYHLARLLFSAEIGLWAALATTSNIIYTVSARAATVDSALVFATTLAMALFVKGARMREDSEAEPGDRPRGLAYLPQSRTVYLVMGIFLGLAILAKGPVGFLLPAASLGLFLLIVNEPAVPPLPETLRWAGRARAFAVRSVRLFSPRKLLHVTWAMRPLTVLTVAALVALPWFVAVAWRTDGQWLAQFVTKYNLGPFVKPFLGHRGPFYYHFVIVLIGFFPWSVFLGPTLIHAYRGLRGRQFPSYLFLICWLGVFFGFWSMCSTKLPHYVLPAYPALAILTGCFVHAWVQRADAAAPHIMPTATSIFLGVGVAMLAILPWVTARYAPGEEIVALLGLVLILGGGAGWYYLARDRRPPYMTAFATSSVLFITIFFGWAALRIDRHQHSRPLLEEVRHDCPAEPQIASYKYCDASTVYYSRGPVEECNEVAKLQDFRQRSPHPYVVTTADEMAQLDKQMPGQWQVLARRPRFLVKGEIVVLVPQSPAHVSRRNGTTER